MADASQIEETMSDDLVSVQRFQAVAADLDLVKHYVENVGVDVNRVDPVLLFLHNFHHVFCDSLESKNFASVRLHEWASGCCDLFDKQRS